MGFIREPKGVDLIINSGPLTSEEEAALSKFIRDWKAKNAQKSPEAVPRKPARAKVSVRIDS